MAKIFHLRTNAHDLFSQEEIEVSGITPWKYVTIEEKESVQVSDQVSIWDYRDNHIQFRDVLDGRSTIFVPFLPMVIYHVPEWSEERKV